MTLQLNDLNQASAQDAREMLKGIYEHSDWIAEQAVLERPFKSIAGLKLVMTRVVSNASRKHNLV
jgi:N-carbamoyl-L-amino-acid hydrolase